MPERTFKEWLSQQLQSRGMRNREVADRVGVSRYAVVKWLAGTARPMPETCKKLAELFGSHPDEVCRLAGW